MPSPSPEQLAEWQRQYGTTGVKGYLLTNQGCEGEVAVYREMTVAERSLLARLEESEEENPGKRPYMRMVVSGCLLFPDSLSEFSTPGMAASELFHRIRQHGHGFVREDDQDIPGDIPESMASDFRRARSSAAAVATDRRYSSEYYRLALRMASIGEERRVDVIAFQELLEMPLGKLRDLAAALEQAHSVMRKEAFQAIRDSGAGKEVAKRIERRYPDILGPLDEASQGLTVPGNELGKTQEPEEEPASSAGGVPPTTPEGDQDAHPTKSDVLQEELRKHFSGEVPPAS